MMTLLSAAEVARSLGRYFGGKLLSVAGCVAVQSNASGIE